jgi:hypothetical protein
MRLIVIGLGVIMLQLFLLTLQVCKILGTLQAIAVTP